MILKDLISDSHCGGFNSGQIHEGVLIANGLVDLCIKQRKLGLIFKLDFQKAFDVVNWSFFNALL